MSAIYLVYIYHIIYHVAIAHTQISLKIVLFMLFSTYLHLFESVSIMLFSTCSSLNKFVWCRFLYLNCSTTVRYGLVTKFLGLYFHYSLMSSYLATVVIFKPEQLKNDNIFTSYLCSVCHLFGMYTP
jgi:hypothetical protein